MYNGWGFSYVSFRFDAFYFIFILLDVSIQLRFNLVLLQRRLLFLDSSWIVGIVEVYFEKVGE